MKTFSTHASNRWSLRRAGRRVATVGLVTATALLACMASAETLYRWIDDNGEVQFSDRQPPPGVEYREVSPRTFAPAPPPPPLTADEDPGASTKYRVVGGEAAPAGPSAAEVAAENARITEQNCRMARERLETFNNLPRVYRTDETGERTRLSEEERQAGIADAQANIERWCQRR